jgi:hypothetical protein
MFATCKALQSGQYLGYLGAVTGCRDLPPE